MKYPKTLISCLLACSAISLSAQQYLLPVDATSSSSFTAGLEDGTIRNRGNDWVAGNNFTTTTATTANAERWVSAAGDTTGWIAYDLGGQYNLSSLNLYNGATNLNRNIQDFDIEVSNDGINWTAATGGTAKTATQASGAADWQNFSFSANNVRHARINVTSNYGDANYTNLSKVLFQGTAAEGQSYLDMSTVSINAGTMGELGSATWPIQNLINGNGINGTSDFANVTADDIGTNNWISASPTGYIELTLAQNTDLQSIFFWNGNDGANAFRGVNQFDILVSSTAAGEDFVETVTNATMGLTSNSDVWVAGENFALDAADVRRIRINVDSNLGAQPLTMMQGIQLVAVPEPSAYALIGGALSLLWVSARRRR